MARLSTMGAASCGTAAIGYFKVGDPQAVQKNKNYLENKEAHAEQFQECCKAVANFYSKVLYPISQPHEQTEHFPFDMLMDAIQQHNSMSKRFIIVCLNESQAIGHDPYWRERIEAHGFELIDITANTIMSGDKNHIFVRNVTRPSTFKVGQKELAAA